MVTLARMDTAEMLITAVDHPSLYGQLGRFVDELHTERQCIGGAAPRSRAAMSRIPPQAVIDHLLRERMMRLGAVVGGRLVAVAAVDNSGAVAVAVTPAMRRRGIANALVHALSERATATGYPPLHRLTAQPPNTAQPTGTAQPARLAG